MSATNPFDIPGFPLFERMRDGIIRCRECACVWAYNPAGKPAREETWTMLSLKSCEKCEPAPMPGGDLVRDVPPIFRWDGKLVEQGGDMVWFETPTGERHGWPQRDHFEAGRLVTFLQNFVAAAGKVIALAVLLGFAAAASAQPNLNGVPIAGLPSWQERAMLVMTNVYRMAPLEARDFYLPGAAAYHILEAYPAQPPLRWALGLNRSTRAHSEDMAEHDVPPGSCFQHNACDGTPWVERFNMYWPGWSLAGESIAAGLAGDPLLAAGTLVADPHDGAPALDGSGWDGHRWNVMYVNYTHLGCGFAMNPKSTYRFYFTQDFGRPLDPAIVSWDGASPIVAGSHVFALGQVWLLVNVYDVTGGVPASVRAVVDGAAADMTLHMGDPAMGTYRFILGDRMASRCHSYHFTVIDQAGAAWRYPASGELWTFDPGSFNAPVGCSLEYTSAGDFNADGAISMADIFDFLAAWMSGDPRTDFDESGGLGVGDVVAFVEAWFEG